jgi:putative ABC transport system substrate-binding protein
MNPKFLWLLTAILLVLPHRGQAQQPANVHRIGFLTATSLSAVSARIEAFRQGLRDVGYMEGKNIVIDYRSVEGKADRLAELAAQLVNLKVEVIVTAGSASTPSAKEATTTIPIVMGFDNDPVGSGFVASLARPGGNITGLSSVSPEMSGKQLELLKEIVPKLSRLALVGDASEPGNAAAVKEARLAAESFGVHLQQLEIQALTDIEIVFREVRNGHAEAVLMLPSAVLLSQRREIAELAIKNRLPATYNRPEYVEAGGLMSYGASITDLFRRAAIYVDKILKGAKPADLPVEQPTKFEFIINLKTAKQIGLTIPPNVLARADRVLR